MFYSADFLTIYSIGFLFENSEFSVENSSVSSMWISFLKKMTIFLKRLSVLRFFFLYFTLNVWNFCSFKFENWKQYLFHEKKATHVLWALSEDDWFALKISTYYSWTLKKLIKLIHSLRWMYNTIKECWTKKHAHFQYFIAEFRLRSTIQYLYFMCTTYEWLNTNNTLREIPALPTLLWMIFSSLHFLPFLHLEWQTGKGIH